MVKLYNSISISMCQKKTLRKFQLKNLKEFQWENNYNLCQLDITEICKFDSK